MACANEVLFLVNIKLDLIFNFFREISGAIAISALFQVFIGFTGLVGKLLKIITPLTIAPCVALVGLTLFDHAAETASKNWPIAVRYLHKKILFKFTFIIFFIARQRFLQFSHKFLST